MAGQITLFSDCNQVTFDSLFKQMSGGVRGPKPTERTCDRPQKGGARSTACRTISQPREPYKHNRFYLCVNVRSYFAFHFIPLTESSQGTQPASSPAEGTPAAVVVV